MPLARDLSNLPAADTTDGRPPDPAPRFVTAIANAWYSATWSNDDRAMAVEGTRLRASWAASCSRDLAYKLAGLPPTDPPSVADAWRMGIGSMVHEALDEYLPAAFPGARFEVQVDLRPSVDASAHADAVIELEDGRTVLMELKSVNGFGYKMMATGKAPEGPKRAHITQGALAAKALDVDELVIGYLSLECVSVNEAKKRGLDDFGRFAAEWTFTRDEYRAIAEAEEKRFEAILKAFDDAGGDPNAVPMRVVLDDGKPATIQDPTRGTWVRTVDGAVVDAGNTWHCGYCWNRTRCQEANR